MHRGLPETLSDHLLLLTPLRKRTMSTSSDRTLIPRKALFGNPDRVCPQLSPDGQKLSFLPLYGVLNVWVGPAGDPDVAEPVTQDTGLGVQSSLV